METLNKEWLIVIFQKELEENKLMQVCKTWLEIIEFMLENSMIEFSTNCPIRYFDGCHIFEVHELILDEIGILSEFFLNEYIDLIDWTYITIRNLSSSSMMNFADKINWEDFFETWSDNNVERDVYIEVLLSIEFNWKNDTLILPKYILKKCKERVNWIDYISYSDNIDLNLLAEVKDSIDWDQVSEIEDLELPILLNFGGRLNWKTICNVNEDVMMIRYKNKNDYPCISNIDVFHISGL
jgi:hypothetical protein